MIKGYFVILRFQFFFYHLKFKRFIYSSEKGIYINKYRIFFSEKMEKSYFIQKTEDLMQIIDDVPQLSSNSYDIVDDELESCKFFIEVACLFTLAL
jgi:hypothetical protein